MAEVVESSDSTDDLYKLNNFSESSDIEDETGGDSTSEEETNSWQQ